MKVVITGISPEGRATIAHQREIPKEALEMLDSTSEGNPNVTMWKGRSTVRLPYRCETTEFSTLEPETFSVSEPNTPKPGEFQFMYAIVPPGFEAPLHSVETADLIVVTAGELWLIMEDGSEVHLKPGDCVVQHGTLHGWHNRGSEDCWIAVTVLGTEKL